MGGLLALETVRELRALGYTVDSVAAIDVLEGPQELRRVPSAEGEPLMWPGSGEAGSTVSPAATCTGRSDDGASAPSGVIAPTPVTSTRPLPVTRAS
ncbi:hypothetical protein ACGFZB_23455 [Streptomyces cinerochromogenes]|uniref:Uncharacterized protein n=1 Tax=Streptomyces cinerochromogenes TaxID=66422 RepID=A0ABW7B884_9ACTN